jgi:hypothetical protein
VYARCSVNDSKKHSWQEFRPKLVLGMGRTNNCLQDKPTSQKDLETMEMLPLSQKSVKYSLRLAFVSDTHLVEDVCQQCVMIPSKARARWS